MDRLFENQGLAHIGIQILRKLDPTTLANCRRVNRSWYDLISGQQFWAKASLDILKMVTKNEEPKRAAEIKWQLWSGVVEKAKKDQSTKILKKLAIFLEKQLRLSKGITRIVPETLNEFDPLVGIEELLQKGDSELAIMVLRWLKIASQSSRNQSWALINSCRLGYEESTKLILSDPFNEGINVNTAYKGFPAIVAACQFYHQDAFKFKGATKVNVVKTLLEHPELNVNAAIGQWAAHLADSALHFAFRHEDIEVIEVLLARNDINVNIGNNHGITPLHYICGIDPIGCGRKVPNITALSLLLNHPNIDVNREDHDYYTPLMMATVVGWPEVVSSLLEMPGINIHLTNTYHHTTAAHYACQSKGFDVLKLLYAHDKEVIHNKTSNLGRTLLHVAVKEADVPMDIVNFLLSLDDFDVNEKDANGATPLHLACQRSIVRDNDVLLQEMLGCEKIDVNARDNNGCTPLLAICQRPTKEFKCRQKSNEVLEILLSCERVDVHVKDNRGRTPLHSACEWSVEKTKILLQDQRIDVNANTTIGLKANMTPLHWACLKNDFDDIRIVRALLSEPLIDVYAKDGEGKTASDYCLLRKWREAYEDVTKTARFQAIITRLWGPSL